MPMNMEAFHCDMFDLRLRFTLEEFDKDAFLKAAGIEDESEFVDEEGNVILHLSFGSRAEPPKDHAHFKIRFSRDQTVQATLSYHQAGKNPVGNEPPNLEDCAEWLGGFLRKDAIEARVNAAYTFREGFAPTIPLPFPLVAADTALSGLKVSGLSLQYPEAHPVDNIILQRDKEGTYLFLQMNTAIKLKEFDLFTELEKMKLTVTSLVKEQEKRSGGNKKIKKT
jgi:hypothetical protein